MIHIVTSDGSCPSLDGQSFNKHWWVFGFNDGCDSDSADLIVSAVGVCSAASRTHRFGGRTGSNQGARSKVNRASRTQHDSTIFATCTRLIISCIWYVVICSQIQFFSAVFIHFPEILSERSRQQRRHLQKSKKNSKHAESTAENLGSQFLHTYMLNLSASCSKCRFFGLRAWLGKLCLKTLFVPFPFILRFSFWTRLCPEPSLLATVQGAGTRTWPFAKWSSWTSDSNRQASHCEHINSPMCCVALGYLSTVCRVMLCLKW